MSAISVLTEQLQAVAPIAGVSIGGPADRTTWRIDYATAPTDPQRLAAEAILAGFDFAAASNAETIEIAAMRTLATDARADAIYTALKSATPAQIGTFVTNNFGGWTAQQRAAIRLLLQVAALLLRRGII